MGRPLEKPAHWVPDPASGSGPGSAAGASPSAPGPEIRGARPLKDGEDRALFASPWKRQDAWGIKH